MNECTATLLAADTVQIATGELLIQGFRVKITSPYTITKPSNLTDINYYLVARIVLSATGGVTFTIEARQTNTLTQDSLFKTGFGTYEIELCRFVVGSSGITDLVQTVRVISGASIISGNGVPIEVTEEEANAMLANPTSDMLGKIYYSSNSLIPMLFMFEEESDA